MTAARTLKRGKASTAPLATILWAVSFKFSPVSFDTQSRTLVEMAYCVPNDASRPILNVEEVRGKIILVDRGVVSLAVKVQHAQEVSPASRRIA